MVPVAIGRLIIRVTDVEQSSPFQAAGEFLLLFEFKLDEALSSVKMFCYIYHHI